MIFTKCYGDDDGWLQMGREVSRDNNNRDCGNVYTVAARWCANTCKRKRVDC